MDPERQPLPFSHIVILCIACVWASIPQSPVNAAEPQHSQTASAKRTPIVVDNAEKLCKAVANVRPGDRIVLRPGEYVLDKPLTVQTQGTQQDSVAIRAETPGAVVLKGCETLSLRSSRWVTLEGLVFAHRLFPHRRWLRVDECDNIRVTRCRFSADETGATEKDKYHSIGIEHSTHVRVDHCDFGPRTTRSMGDYISAHTGSRYLQIDHNDFKHRANIGQNGGESVMLHGSGVWSIYAVVEHNRFERCNGEGELIGLKSSRNVIRNNTLINCEGAISIRAGNYNHVYDNIILNLYPPGAKEGRRIGGVRVFGVGNEVVNNYMYRLAFPLEACWGDSDPPREDDSKSAEGRMLGYLAAYDNLIAHNTMIGCECVLYLAKTGLSAAEAFRRIEKEDGYIRAHRDMYQADTAGAYVTPHFPPRHWCFLNNLAVDCPKLVYLRVFREARPPYEEQAFEHCGNAYHTTDPAIDFVGDRKLTADQWRRLDPQLVAPQEAVYELAPTSLLKNAARRDFAGLEKWFADTGMKPACLSYRDVGANLPVRPLGPQDVGVLAP